MNHDWVAGRSVLITGGNAGIGRATARALATRGAQVTIACRNAERAAEARADIAAATGTEIDVLSLDLGSLESIRGAAAEFIDRHGSLDVLVNNAGVAALGRRRATHDGFEIQFGVNHLGHFLLTTLLLDHLTGRIVNVSSAAYGLARQGLRWEDLQWERDYDGWQAYGASKLCNLYFTWELADRCSERGVTVNALHPGFVDTGLGHRRPEDGGRPRPAPPNGARDRATSVDIAALGTPLAPEQGARTSIMLAADASVAGVTGAYYDDTQRRIDDLGPIVHDRVASARLWRISEELVAER
jgi:NAD(P)-dependent dehydrogenase (short-subunit alcohol dehydrogenase family)